jgi:hypothetical protein
MSDRAQKKSKKNTYVAVTKHPIDQIQKTANGWWFDRDQAFTHPIECLGLFHTFEGGVRFILEQVFKNDSVVNDEPINDDNFDSLPNLVEDSQLPDEDEFQEWRENLHKFRANEWTPSTQDELFNFFEYIRHGELLNCVYEKNKFQIEWIDLVNIPNVYPREGISVIYSVSKDVEIEPSPPTPQWDIFWKKNK